MASILRVTTLSSQSFLTPPISPTLVLLFKNFQLSLLPKKATWILTLWRLLWSIRLFLAAIGCTVTVVSWCVVWHGTKVRAIRPSAGSVTGTKVISQDGQRLMWSKRSSRIGRRSRQDRKLIGAMRKMWSCYSLWGIARVGNGVNCWMSCRGSEVYRMRSCNLCSFLLITSILALLRWFPPPIVLKKIM